MSEVYLNRVFPAMRSAYPTEWVSVIDKALKLDVDQQGPVAVRKIYEEIEAKRKEGRRQKAEGKRRWPNKATKVTLTVLFQPQSPASSP